MKKTGFQLYRDQERMSQLVLHNFEVASRIKKGEIQFNHVFIDLEQICNLACHGCFEHTNKNQSRKKLSYEEITKIVDFAYERDAKVIIIAGAGEPTLDKDFKRIIKYIYQKEMCSVVFTNGSTLDEELSNFMFEQNVSPIVKKFSTDFDKQDYLIRKKGMSERMQKGLEILMQVKKERERTGKRMSEIGIESYISKENINDIKEILRYCRKNAFVPYLEAFITRGQDEETAKLSPSQEQLNRLFEELAKIDEKEFGIKTLLNQGSPVYGGGACLKGKVSFAVHVDGSVYECVSGSYNFGNTREKSLREIFDLKNTKIKKFYSDKCLCSPCSLTYQREF